eukprot:m.161060 g.161060  ORF g.161060 m.161060 type:complete len:1008 (+) comp16517_c0_seq2:108-3131(+)
MPATIKVRIGQARDLPVMDSNSQLTDAYVEIKLNQKSEKTPIIKKSLNPQFDFDCRFEVDDDDLQDQVLQLNVLDHDYMSQDDTIGQVIIDIKPLLKVDVNQLSGWWPIYDTLRGVRGSLHVTVKLSLIQDHHRFRDTSVDVLFFTTMALPKCYRLLAIFGLAEELIVNDDPEFQWIDRLRPTRASNQARQKVFTSLTGQLQRQLGVKARERGGNAVLGYRQSFDLEGETGLVARGLGTIVHLQYQDPAKLASSLLLRDSPPLPRSISHDVRRSPLSKGDVDDVELSQSPPLLGISPAKSFLNSKPSGLNASADVALLTMCSFPPDLLQQLGGIVVARSIKLLNRIDNPDETDARDGWWEELRREVKASARQLGYGAVVGYVETTTICNNICLLSATGTAANVNTDLTQGTACIVHSNTLEVPLAGSRRRRRRSTSDIPMSAPVDFAPSHHTIREDDEIPAAPCELYHLPQGSLDSSFVGAPSTCHICQHPTATVPEILFTTVDPPEDLPFLGCSTMIQARVCRSRRRASSKPEGAIALGEAIPFLEHDLHEQLYNKMKLRGMNALFNLRIQLTVGETMTVAVATATGMHLACLPSTPVLQFRRTQRMHRNSLVEDKLLQESELQRGVLDDLRAKDLYRAHRQLSHQSSTLDAAPQATDSDRKIVLVDIDDDIDLERVEALQEVELNEGMYLCSTQRIRGLEETFQYTAGDLLDTFTAVVRTRLDPKHLNASLSAIFRTVLQTIGFKYRDRFPFLVTNLRWDVALPENHDIQVVVTASVVALEHVTQARRKTISTSSGNKEQDRPQSSTSTPVSPSMNRSLLSRQSLPAMPSNARPASLDLERALHADDVIITPLNNVPGQQTERHLGAVILYFIKETMSLRDTGGIGRFTQHFIREVLAIARAEVVARGGNALVVSPLYLMAATKLTFVSLQGYRIRDLDILDNPSKNQGQCLIAVQGDALLTSVDESAGLDTTLDAGLPFGEAAKQTSAVEDDPKRRVFANETVV